MAKTRALGKGLGALLSMPGESAAVEKKGPGDIHSLPVRKLRPNPSQPRREMDEVALDSLTESVRIHGVVQPLVVRQLEGTEDFEIVAGERRWRAAAAAGLEEVPVRVIQGTERELREISLVENIQREDLSPLEIAGALSDLLDDFSLTQEEAASRIGWSRTAVSNRIRLLQLPDEVKNMLAENLISEGHCRALLSLDSAETIIALARTAEEKGMSVRQVEDAVKRAKTGIIQPKTTPSRYFIRIPQTVSEMARGRGISLKVTGSPNKAKISIDGLSHEQLEHFFRFLEEKGDELFPGR